MFSLVWCVCVCVMGDGSVNRCRLKVGNGVTEGTYLSLTYKSCWSMLTLLTNYQQTNCCLGISVRQSVCIHTYKGWESGHWLSSHMKKVCECVSEQGRGRDSYCVSVSLCVLAAVGINQYWSPGRRVPPKGRMLMLSGLFLFQSQRLFAASHTLWHTLVHPYTLTLFFL